jgi:hypothetical protein
MNEANTLEDVIGPAAAPFPRDPQCPPGMVVQDFPIIAMGHGLVEVGDATHEGLPALWFGRGGRGLDAPPEDINRPAHNGETLALFTFADARGIDAIESALKRIRAMFGFAQNGEG